MPGWGADVRCRGAVEPQRGVVGLLVHQQMPVVRLAGVAARALRRFDDRVDVDVAVREQLGQRSGGGPGTVLSHLRERNNDGQALHARSNQ